MSKISALPVLTAPDKADLLPIEDVSATTTKGITLQTLFGMIYPVGSVYTNANNSTNPGTLLGFGTWAAHGAGRVNVGVGTSDQAFAAAATGGESNHMLTLSEIPSHSHNWQSGNATATGGGTSGVALNNAGFNVQGPTVSQGGGGAHNNLQPYVVVYMWVRTA